MSDVIDSAEIDRIERGPDRIWATVNGASTRVPDGGRQLLGGWSEDSERPRAIEYVRADLYAALVTEVMEGREHRKLLLDAINSGRNEPLMIARDKVYADLKETDNAGE